MSSELSDEPFDPRDVSPNASDLHGGDTDSVSAPSPPPTSAPSGKHGDGGRKKSSRTLTPAQLAKKRANDREAQRAIRERTKTQIETLENRIKELESEAPFQHMQAAIKEKEIILAENADLKKRLATILDLVHPDSPTAGKARELSSQLEDIPKSAAEIPPTYTLPIGYSAPTTSPPSNSYANTDSPGSSANDKVDVTMQPMENDHADLRTHGGTSRMDFLGLNNTHGNQGAPGQGTDPSKSSQYGSASGGYFPPPHSQLPNNTSPSCTYDQIHLDYARANRQELAAGADVSELLGPPEPDATPLIDPSAVAQLPPSRIEALLMDQFKAFSYVRTLPEQLTCLRNLHTFIRWYVSPTSDNYYNMSEYMRPVNIQIQVPHPLWIDHLPWPQMRFKLVTQYHHISLDTFFLPFSQTFCVNWPLGEATAACLSRDSEVNEMRLSPVFRDHITDLSNLTLGPTFAEAFPELEGTVRIMIKKSRSMAE